MYRIVRRQYSSTGFHFWVYRDTTPLAYFPDYPGAVRYLRDLTGR